MEIMILDQNFVFPNNAVRAATHTVNDQGVVAGLQRSFPMPCDRPEWSRSNPEHFLEK
jgi:hypothetical protein